ncbi:MAG: hypothetical protein RMY34_18295 [Aulosira sp. DedQUE10]|nr:hypothetical protein [Aulosira sp. DedQUE10]
MRQAIKVATLTIDLTSVLQIESHLGVARVLPLLLIQLQKKRSHNFSTQR